MFVFLEVMSRKTRPVCDDLVQCGIKEKGAEKSCAEKIERKRRNCCDPLASINATLQLLLMTTTTRLQLLEGDIKRPTLLIEYKLCGIFTPVLFTSLLNLKKKINKKIKKYRLVGKQQAVVPSNFVLPLSSGTPCATITIAF